MLRRARVYFILFHLFFVAELVVSRHEVHP